MNIKKKLISLFIGNTLASLGISMVVNSGLGCFAVTAMNISISNLTGLSIGTIGMLLELTMLLIATYYGEGLGVTAIVNAVYGSYLTDFFIRILPIHPLMVLGLLLAPLGWMLMDKAEMGNTGSNILMTAILKKTKKSISLIRGCQECIYMIIGLIGARNCVTPFTLLLSIFFGSFLQFIYKLLKYDPTEIEHKYIIKRGDRHEIKKEM